MREIDNQIQKLSALKKDTLFNMRREEEHPTIVWNIMFLFLSRTC